ncbi:hypothetical protein D770_13350 [Flammeovirgaceae bacterium 311]|nr:hypothetical protein D770_13350 [Flammeovirgaceae bacterium 311]
MADYPFRDLAPVRTYTGAELANYRAYKVHLRKDFNNKCGYTHCLDHWFGGIHSFQIDHFLPQSTHPNLSKKYTNLIYCCSYVNRAKSNDEGNCIDPCDEDFNDHLYRDKLGNIHPKPSSDRAVNMHRKLKLYLKRYSLIWMLEQLEIKMERLKMLFEKTGDEDIKTLFCEVSFKYIEYKQYLRAQQ